MNNGAIKTMLDQMIELAFKANADRNQSVFSYDSTILSHIIGGSKGAKR